MPECHICAELRNHSTPELCPCCDYDGCLHIEDPVEILDWWVFSDSTVPLFEWFTAKVNERIYR